MRTGELMKNEDIDGFLNIAPRPDHLVECLYRVCSQDLQHEKHPLLTSCAVVKHPKHNRLSINNTRKKRQ